MLSPALATDAAYLVKQLRGLSKVVAIMNPLTGKPMKSNISISVFFQTFIEAYALTKAVLLARQKFWNQVLTACAAWRCSWRPIASKCFSRRNKKACEPKSAGRGMGNGQGVKDSSREVTFRQRAVS